MPDGPRPVGAGRPLLGPASQPGAFPLTSPPGICYPAGMPQQLIVVVTPHFAVRRDQLARLAHAHPRAELRFAETPEELSAALPEADAVITSFPLIAADLAAAQRLRWIMVMGGGVESYLTPELRRSGILVTATKGPMGVLMAEHAMALMLALARDLRAYARDQEARRWRPYAARRPFVELSGKTIAVLGVGSVGSALARMCKLGFGMGVLGMARTRRDDPNVDRYVDRAALHGALREADVVALTLPLTPATERILDATALAAMRPGALLLNVSRGRLVDEAALVGALRSGRLGGAGLDVFAVEPLPVESPLWAMPNVVITPHTSAITERLGDHFAAFWSDNIRRFAEGQPLLGVVDAEQGY